MIRASEKVIAERLGLDNFADSALSRALEYLPEPTLCGPWVAGGAVRRTIAGDPLDSDIDFFFADAEQFKDFDRQLKKYKTVSSDMNVSYLLPRKKIDDTWRPELKVQAINFRYYANLEEVLDSFDFTITQFGYDGHEFVMADWALWDLAKKRLVVHKISYAVASMRRLLKYTRQGYTACAGTMATLLEQVVENPGVINEEVKYID